MELDSGADSVSSTPRAAHPKFGGGEDRSVVRLMCSFGGKILPRPHDNQLRYVGGDTRIVAVHRNTTYVSLVSKLSKLVNSAGDFTVKYQLPNEDLDALITVSTDEDVDNMMEEFERLISQQINNSNNNSNNSNNNSNRVPRLRLFLFPFTGIEESDTSRTSSIASLLDGSRKRENWFLDALNGGAAAAAAGAGAPSLERGRSEASSIVSEVPDYLFGLDNSDDTVTKLKNRAGLGDGMPGSAPGSPAFGSTSSASQMPNLPPVKTKLENPNPVEEVIDPQTHQTGGYAVTSGGQVWGHGSNPGSPYPVHHAPVQNFPPVYYVQAGPGQGLIQHRNSNLQPVPVSVPIQGHFVQQYGPGQGQSQGQIQVPVGYAGSGPVYGPRPVRTVGGVDPYEMQMQGNNMVQGQGPSGLSQPMYYGVNNTGMVASYPGMVVSQAGEDIRGSGPDLTMGRTLQP